MTTELTVPAPARVPALALDRAVSCRRVVHVYGEPGGEVAALRGIDLDVARGESVAVLGPSGSGKSTLLWLVAGLVRPTAGEIAVDGVALGPLTAAALRRVRAGRVGVLLQNPGRGLLPYATCRENLVFARPRPARGTGWTAWRARRAAARQQDEELLDRVGIADRRDAVAGTLSGGEQQRLGLAVALAGGPAVLLADEPTSQLDPESAEAVVELLAAVPASRTAVLVVTHDPAVATAMRRTVTIADGRIGRETRDGREVVVVGAEGQVHLPPDVLDLLPPGSSLQVERLPDGVRLRHVDAGEPS